MSLFDFLFPSEEEPTVTPPRTDSIVNLAAKFVGELPALSVLPYDHLIVHCAATKATMDNVDAVWIDRLHRRKGWLGCGYNAVITRDGELQHQPTGHPTRPYGKRGAHVGDCGVGWNTRSVGVCLAGGVASDGKTPEDNFTEDQFRTLSAYIAAVMAAYKIPAQNVMGHRDLIRLTNAPPKACPSFDVGLFMERDMSDDTYVPEKPQRRADQLRVPVRYTVQEGDSLWRIASTYGVSINALKNMNADIRNSDVIIPGQRIRLR
jgi:LysM repeat protein